MDLPWALAQYRWDAQTILILKTNICLCINKQIFLIFHMFYILIIGLLIQFELRYTR